MRFHFKFCQICMVPESKQTRDPDYWSNKYWQLSTVVSSWTIFSKCFNLFESYCWFIMQIGKCLPHSWSMGVLARWRFKDISLNIILCIIILVHLDPTHLPTRVLRYVLAPKIHLSYKGKLFITIYPKYFDFTVVSHSA